MPHRPLFVSSSAPGHFHKQAARTRKGSGFPLASCLYRYGMRRASLSLGAAGALLPLRPASASTLTTTLVGACAASIGSSRTWRGAGSSRLVRPECDDGRGRRGRGWLAGRLGCYASPPWRGGRPAPPCPLPLRQQVARGRPVASRDPFF